MAASWWRPPRLRTDEDQHLERRTSWLELFFDLVFVAVIAVLAHDLSGDPSWGGVGTFVFLFLPVWWVWVGATIYSDRLESDDVSHRLLHFAIMVPVVSLAFFAHDALGDTSAGFALSYAAARAITIGAWLRGGWHNPQMRPLTNRYAVGYSLSVALWVISIFVPAPARFMLWGAGLTIDHLTPVLTVQIQQRMPSLSMSRLPERLGLFTIIVLGESVIGVANGIAGLDGLSAGAGATGALGLALACALWWVYFDQVGDHHQRVGRHRSLWGIAWVYLHFPLLLGLTAIGAGTLELIARPAEVPFEAVRWLLCGAAATVFLAIGAIVLTQESDEGAAERHALVWAARIGAAAIALAVGAAGTQLTSVALMAILFALASTQVALLVHLSTRAARAPQTA